MEKLAFVDICGTLYKSNTTFDFLSYCNKSFLSAKTTFTMKVVNKLYRVLFNKDYIRNKKLKVIVGKERSVLLQEMNKFYDLILDSKKIREVHSLVNRLRNAGYEIILLSATLDFIAEVISQKVEADLVYATTLSYKDSFFTGKVSKDLFGKKHHIASKLLKENKHAKDIIVITDDETDIKLAQLATHVYVISSKGRRNFWVEKLGKKVKFIEE